VLGFLWGKVGIRELLKGSPVKFNLVNMFIPMHQELFCIVLELEGVDNVDGLVSPRIFEVQLNADRELSPSRPPQHEGRLHNVNNVVGLIAGMQKETNFLDEVQVGILMQNNNNN